MQRQKKRKKNSATPATTKVATKKTVAARSKKAVNKERVEDGQEEAQDSDKKRKPCIHYLNTLYLYLCYHPRILIVKAHGIVADAWMCFKPCWIWSSFKSENEVGVTQPIKVGPLRN